MSHYDYIISQQLSASDPPFYALIMAAMRKASSTNIDKLRFAFPDVYEELLQRYHAPGGRLESDPS